MLAFYVMMVDTPEDKALIEKLYALYECTMYGVAHNILKNRYDAEDAVHEAFLCIIRGNCLHELSEINSSKTKGYIIVAAKNAALKIFNKRKKNSSDDIDEYPDLHSDESVEETALSSISVLEIKEALILLKERERDILRLHLINRLTSEQISEIMDIRAEAVRQRIHRAKAHFYEILRERGLL